MFSILPIGTSVLYLYDLRYITSDEGLDFLANVVDLDVAQYNVQTSQHTTPVTDPSVKPLIDRAVKYRLTSGENS